MRQVGYGWKILSHGWTQMHTDQKEKNDFLIPGELSRG
jgi:hypothetical protein